MKVIYFYQYFGTPKGSWSTRVYELTRRWVKEGHSVTVVTTPYDKSDIESEGFISSQNYSGINVIVVNSGDSNRFPIWKRMIRAINFSLISIYYALSRKYDVAIASSGPMTIGLPLIAAKIFRGKRTIFEVRDLWPWGAIELGLIKKGWQSSIAIFFEKLCYKKADAIVTASIGQKKHIQKRFPKKKIEVIPNASDIEIFGKSTSTTFSEWDNSKKLFTHIGSLGLIHNTKYWLKVARELKELDVNHSIEMIFIGEGVDRPKLEEEKKRLGLHNLHFLGLKSKSELPIWVQNSVATLFATTSNPVQDTSSPNKIFDSFAAGVPIVQTSKGWIYDLVQEENCGVNISLENPKEAANKIIWLSENKEACKNMGQNALRLAKTIFNRDILAEKYLALINEICDVKKEKPSIVYFYQYFGTPKGSWSTRVYELSKRWVEAGYNVKVVTSPYYKSDIKASGFISKSNIEDIELTIINAADSNKYSFLKRTRNAVVFAIMSMYYAFKLDYDVAICSSGPLTIGLPGIIAKIVRGKKFVFEVRDLWPQGSVELGKIRAKMLIDFAYWFEKVCYKNADFVVPCSIDMEKSILNRYPETNTCIIPNASDSSFYITPHEMPKAFPEFVKDKHIILYAGSLGLMDDCMQIIEAARLFKKEPIAIVFAGDGAEKPVLEAAVKDYELDNVFFTGLLPKTDIIKWFFLSKASLVTFKNLPILSSNSPNKMFDSFAAGVPIIQTTKGWIKTLVDEEQCGINVEPHRPFELAAAILKMVHNEEERKFMAQNAFRLAKTVFDRDQLSEKYMNAIELAFMDSPLSEMIDNAHA